MLINFFHSKNNLFHKSSLRSVLNGVKPIETSVLVFFLISFEIKILKGQKKLRVFSLLKHKTII